MPVIKRQQPPLPPGMYCGIAKQVSVAWQKLKQPKVNADGTTIGSVQVFTIPLHISGGQKLNATLRVMEATAWIFEQLAKSGELLPPPEGQDYLLQTDDIENRRFFFEVIHDTFNGAIVTNVRFHAPNYAIQVNPSLEGIMFEGEAPRGVPLRSATPSSTPPAEAPAPTPQHSTPAQPPVSDAETISEEESQQALEYVKKLRQQRQEGK